MIAAASACHQSYNLDPHVDVFGFWTASDIFEEFGPHVSPYGNDNQYYGILTIDGVPKPAFYAFKFLSRMLGRRFEISFPEDKRILANGIATGDASCTRCLFWNYHHPPQDTEIWKDTVRIPIPAALSGAQHVRIISAHCGIGHGSAHELWAAIGKPRNLTALEMEMFKSRATPRYSCSLVAPKNGVVETSFELKRNEILFIEIASEAGGDIDTGAAEQYAAMNKALLIPNS